MRRRELLGAAAAALGTTVTMRAAGAASTTVTTQLQWIKDSQNAGWWVADAEGYFRAAGIDSNVLAGGPNMSEVEAIVAAGRADIGVDQFERVVDANAAGADLVIIGALYQSNPAALLSLPAHPVRSARDILGKRLGLQQGATVYIDAIMTANHLPKTYTEIVVGSTPDPLLQGACDAYLCFITNQPLILAEQGIPYVTATFDQLGYVTYTDCLFCRRDYIRDNRDTLVRYMRALQHGWATSVRDPELGARLAVTTYGVGLGLNERKELATSRAQGPLLQSDATRTHGMLWIDKQRVAGPVYATLRATGRTHLPAVDHLVDTSILIEAHRA
jgi:ABC-type nitrate/sulfonate/bicarbonate transport system substrate-binding protein